MKGLTLRIVGSVVLATTMCIGSSLGQIADWASVPASSGATIGIEQSVISVRDGSTVSCFSALTRKWSQYVATAAPTVTRFNDHIMIKDGPNFIGFSSRTGTFEAIATTAPGAALTSAAANSWLNAVVDGAAVHVYNGFKGGWQTYAVNGAPTVSNGRYSLVIGDADGVRGFSGYYDTPVNLAIPGATVIGAYTNAALASVPGAVWGYSAVMNSWTSVAVASAPTVSAHTQLPGYVVVREGATIFHFYSGQTATFTTLVTSAAATLALQRQVAAVQDGTTVHLFSGIRGTLTTLNFASVPTVYLKDFLAIVDDGTALLGYSAPYGIVSAPLTGSFAVATNQNVAAVTPTGGSQPSHVYSTVLNAWTAVPTIPGCTAYVGTAMVVLADPAGGLYGLSVVGNQWVAQAAPPLSNYWMPFATFVGQSGNSLFAFNPRTERWLVQQTAAPITQSHVYYDVGTFTDGINAYAVSLLTDRWSSTPVLAQAVGIQSQVTSAYVFDGVKVYGYGGSGQLSSTAEYPFFWRQASLGSLLRLDLAAEPFSPSVVFASVNEADISYGVYGRLLVDPNAFVIVATPFQPAVGTWFYEYQIPQIPALVGYTVNFQAFVWGGPYGGQFTESLQITIL